MPLCIHLCGIFTLVSRFPYSGTCPFKNGCARTFKSVFYVVLSVSLDLIKCFDLVMSVLIVLRLFLSPLRLVISKY